MSDRVRRVTLSICLAIAYLEPAPKLRKIMFGITLVLEFDRNLIPRHFQKNGLFREPC